MNLTKVKSGQYAPLAVAGFFLFHGKNFLAIICIKISSFKLIKNFFDCQFFLYLDSLATQVATKTITREGPYFPR